MSCKTTTKENLPKLSKVSKLTWIRYARNELTPVGNAPVNARGDELGPGGKIIKKRDDVIRDYYEEHPKRLQTK